MRDKFRLDGICHGFIHFIETIAAWQELCNEMLTLFWFHDETENENDKEMEMQMQMWSHIIHSNLMDTAVIIFWNRN
jgi:hypothetical protein